MKFDQFIDESKDDLITSTQELIKIKSTEEAPLGDYPFGEGVQRSLEYVLDLGKKFGLLLSKKAELLGGIILVGIGVEIFLSHILA